MKKTYEWLQRAIEQGDADTHRILGIAYFNGDCVPKDMTKAVQLWQQSAEQGNADARFYLGLCYYFGNGVRKDLDKATEWLQEIGSHQQQLPADIENHLPQNNA